MKTNVRQLLKKSEEQLLPPSISEAPVESSSLRNLLTLIESKLTPAQLTSVKEIGTAIGTVGLSLADACLRSRVSKEELETLTLYVPEIKTYFQLKQVEYKYKLLNVVTKHVTENGDVKIAMWLLEKQYADEYDNSMKKDLAKMNRNAEADVVEMAFAFVRKQSSTTMPIQQEAGAAKQLNAGIKTYDMKDLLV